MRIRSSSLRELSVCVVLLATDLTLSPAAAAAQADLVGEPSAAVGQETSAPSAGGDTSPASLLRTRASLTGMLVIPTDSRGEASAGFQIGLGFGWGKIPLQLGLDIGFSAAWKEGFTFPLKEMPGLLVEETRQDKFYFMNAWLRLQPMDWPFVLPYAEGFAGGKLLQTEYTLSFAGGDGITSQTANRDLTRSLGWGMGVDIALARKSPRLFVMLGVRRLYSGDANFSQAARTTTGDVRATLQVPMDSWQIHVGFSGAF